MFFFIKPIKSVDILPVNISFPLSIGKGARLENLDEKRIWSNPTHYLNYKCILHWGEAERGGRRGSLERGHVDVYSFPVSIWPRIPLNASHSQTTIFNHKQKSIISY